MASGSFLMTAASLQLVSTRDPTFAPSASGGGDSGLPIISTDGRYVLFASTADNLVLTTSHGSIQALVPGRLNVFLRDRTNGTTTLVSVNSAGTGGGNENSIPMAISLNGRYALFESAASNLVTGDINNVNDVFIRDLVTGATSLVSTAANGRSGNGASRDSVMTPDGRYVAFVSAATNLVAGDTNQIPDVFVRDLQAGTTTLVSVGAKSPNPVTAAGSSEGPGITPDGRYVVFYSTATNLVSGITTSSEIYIRDRVAGNTTWASVNARTVLQSVIGSTNGAAAYNQVLSEDGRFVAFEASAFPIGSTFARGIVLRYDRQTGLNDIVHTNANVALVTSENILDMTPDGRFIAFLANVGGPSGTNTAIYFWDAQAGTNTLASGDLNNALPVSAICDSPAITPDGHYIAFVSSAPSLTTNTLAGEYHIYVRDTQAGITRLADADGNGVGSGVNPTTVPGLSADGRFVAFESAAGNLALDDRNHGFDVFVQDGVTDQTELISARNPVLPSASADGSSGMISFSVSTNDRVAFVSEARELVTADTNGVRDVFVRNLLTGSIVLVSVDTNGITSGNAASIDTAISGDGRYVAFSSAADNLVPGDTNYAQDVFVRDLQSKSTTLVSVSTNGVDPGDHDSFSPAIGADGRFVLFRSKARNLAPGLTAIRVENLFLRDLQTGTTYALTTATSASSRTSAEMTPDGRFVAVATGADAGATLFVWETQSAGLIYTNSARNSFVSISPDGHRVAYRDAVSSAFSVADIIANTNWVISVGPIPDRLAAQFSGDGRFLAYATSAADSPSDTNATQDVYLYDFQTGTNSLLSRSFNSSATSNGPADSPAISPDGRFVAYRSSASDNVPGDFNGVPDLEVYDRLNRATILVTVNQSTYSTANNRSLSPVFSGDGTTLVFLSWASDLLDNDFNHASDLFTFNLASPRLTDSDGDRMDDPWELDHFVTLTRDGTGDFDGDGAADLFEFQTGTDPGDPASSFRLEVVPPTPEQSPALTWPLAPGKSYRVQFKNDLNDPDWQELNGNVTLLRDKGFVNDLDTASGLRFYRVLLAN